MKRHISIMAAALYLLFAGTVSANNAEPGAAALGGSKYTCWGSLRAGTESGVAKYTGKYYKNWPGLKQESGYVPGPYADEKPILKITAQNYKKYKDRLSTGMEAMFEQYPDVFYMNIYPSHRDFSYHHDYLCKAATYNAKHAKLVDGGLGVHAALGAPVFPFAETGLQAIWNVIFTPRAWSTEVTYSTVDVHSDGSTTHAKSHFKTFSPLGMKNADGGELVKTTDSDIAAYFFREPLLPTSAQGKVAVGFQPMNFNEGSTQVWQYQPGLRRVRKAPKIGFDYPVPPSGLRTVDDDSGFSGSPERYNWKLVGRKAMYVPYNNFKINDPSLSTQQLTKPHTLNPKYIRYELHRVWIIEGTLKDGYRHIYEKRRLYVDEDGWRVLTADMWDNHGDLYRVSMILWFYSQQSGTYQRGVSIYHSLPSGAYEATYMVNDTDQWWQFNQPMKQRSFSPRAAARAGQ